MICSLRVPTNFQPPGTTQQYPIASSYPLASLGSTSNLLESTSGSTLELGLGSQN
jgi:hypothetical protein